MSDRLEAAVAELVAALRDELRADAGPVAPDRLLNVDQVREALGGLARSKVYGLFASGELRSIRVGRRRMVSSGAIQDYIAGRAA